MPKPKNARTALLTLGLIGLLVALSGCGGARFEGAVETEALPTEPREEPQYDYAGVEVEEAAVEEAAGGRAFAPEPGLVDTSTTVEVAPGQFERLIIRTGNVSVMVEDTKKAEAAIEAMVSEMAADGAFIVSREQYGGSDTVSPYITMTIRVPVVKFDSAMDRISALAAKGTQPTRSESGQDVTEEYVDLDARLQSLEAARDRLIEIMKNAQTTEELLMAEQQLTQREAEIESIKGRMQYLSESARLSSIQISLEPYFVSQPVDARWRPIETVRRAVDALIRGLRGFADFLIFFTIAILPWLVLFGLVIYGIVRFVLWRVRVGRAKRAAQAGSGGTQ